MATARKHVERRYVEDATITLTLSPEEAETIAAVLGKVSGHVVNTDRKHTDAVHRALEAAGVSWFGRPILKSLSGELEFRPRG